MTGRVARALRRRLEHYRVLTAMNDLSTTNEMSITVNQVARRAGVSPDRAMQVLQRRYVQRPRSHRRTGR